MNTIKTIQNVTENDLVTNGTTLFRIIKANEKSFVAAPLSAPNILLLIDKVTVARTTLYYGKVRGKAYDMVNVYDKTEEEFFQEREKERQAKEIQRKQKEDETTRRTLAIVAHNPNLGDSIQYVFNAPNFTLYKATFINSRCEAQYITYTAEAANYYDFDSHQYTDGYVLDNVTCYYKRDKDGSRVRSNPSGQMGGITVMDALVKIINHFYWD